MNHQTLFLTVSLILVIVACGLKACEGNPTCEFPYAKTDGEIINTTHDKYFTAQPFEIISDSTALKCLMVLNASPKAKAMNVVVANKSDVTCQFFQEMFNDGTQNGDLLEQKGSTYYEKDDNFVKATKKVIVVGAKDDKPGRFIFQLPTGHYKIKLKHLNGGLSCHQNQPVMMPFGCQSLTHYHECFISLFTGYNGPVIVWASQFSEFEGNATATNFVATSHCFHLTQGEDYSFWYYQDYEDNNESNNSGETYFEMFVRFCEKKNECI